MTHHPGNVMSRNMGFVIFALGVVICPFLCYTFMSVVIHRLLCHVVVIRLNHTVCTTVPTCLSVDWLYDCENLLCGLGVS